MFKRDSKQLTSRSSNCNLFQKEITVLEHVVSEGGVHTDPDKTKAVQNWPIPSSTKEKSFLGLCACYRCYVKGFVTIAHPLLTLHQACQKNKKFHWTNDCTEDSRSSKDAQVSFLPPILIYPVPCQGFILATDASNMAVRAVLSQIQDYCEKVVFYYSKALNEHEQFYCTTRKEFLAAVRALKHFHPYLDMVNQSNLEQIMQQ